MRVPVLMYHRITAAPRDARLRDLWVAPDRFRRQLAELKERGWRSITAEELARAFQDRRHVGEKRFVITIDDGVRDGYVTAAPILADLGMHATFFVNPGKATRNGRISFPQMRLLRLLGHDIANHSMTHAALTRLGASELRRQIEGAQQLFRRQLGYRPLTFCYPYGSHNPTVRARVAASGFVLAFTTASGARESTNSPLESPRVRVHGLDSPRELAARLAPFAAGR
jgi:peptidoglycan/xylan/chitin deacetylase (PgdA/CDA1 family)